jgi:hypothetical protein
MELTPEEALKAYYEMQRQYRELVVENARIMKLYVWEDVLCSYTCGIAFALAGSLEEAKNLVANHYNANFGWKGDEYKIPNFLEEDDPKIFDAPVGYTVWGGG